MTSDVSKSQSRSWPLRTSTTGPASGRAIRFSVSRRSVVPSIWHHIVGQKSSDVLELNVDGECVGTTPAKADPPDDGDVTTACRLLVGRLKQRRGPPSFR